jgi:hypothetical protein
MVKRESAGEIKKDIMRAAPYVMIAAIAFFIYQAYVLLNSFSAMYDIALSATSRWQSSG